MDAKNRYHILQFTFVSAGDSMTRVNESTWLDSRLETMLWKLDASQNFLDLSHNQWVEPQVRVIFTKSSNIWLRTQIFCIQTNGDLWYSHDSTRNLRDLHICHSLRVQPLLIFGCIDACRSFEYESYSQIYKYLQPRSG